MFQFKSSAKLHTPIDFQKQFVIEKLYGDPKTIDEHSKKIKELHKDASPAFVAFQIDSIIIRENAFNLVMEYLVTLFDFFFDANEVANIMEALKQSMPNLDEKELTSYTHKTIQKGLIFNHLATAHNLTISDADAKQYLDHYYAATNNSIHEYLNNEQKFKEVKEVLFEEKVMQWIIFTFKISLSIKNILNRKAPKNEQQTVETKKN